MPDPALRAIRVFVSSTFRDMVDERNQLATHVWPALRALCEDRAASFTDVDLRWGITREQAERGEVLPICLAEIDASRPYFIGILGERYGWVPEEIAEDLVRQMPWLSEHRLSSVTELEIVHGVLNDPAMAGRAFFYLRDPSYSAKVPQERRADFESESPESAAKLASLKDRLRGLGLLRTEGFRTPEELASLVAADLTAAIEQSFPAEKAPSPLARSGLAHEAYARSRAGVYIGRDIYFSALDAQAEGSGPPLVVVGKSGGGKSALLANWAQRYRLGHPRTPIVEHYTGAGADATDWAAMCRRIVGELAASTGMDLQLPDSPDELRAAFRKALSVVAEAGPAVIVLDGLNQLEDRNAALDLSWMPTELPAEIRVIASALPGRALEEARRRGWTELEVEPLTALERSELAAKYLAGFAKNLDAGLLTRLAEAPQSANPLFLRVLLDEVRVAASFEDLEATVESYLAAADPAALYALVLARWEREYDGAHEGLTRDTMSALWAARRGLSESEVLALLGGDGAPLPRAAFSPLYLAARTALVSRSGLLGFAHDFLRIAVEERFLPTTAEQQTAHKALANHFEGLDPRSIDERPWQFMAAAAWPELAALLTDVKALSAILETGAAFDARRYWVALEGAGISAEDSYSDVLELMDDESRAAVGRLLLELGHAEAAEDVLKYEVRASLRAGDPASALAALESLSLALEERGDLKGAMQKLSQLSFVYRLFFDGEQLQYCQSRKAAVLYAYGYKKTATKRLKRVERICRRRGYQYGLAHSLNMQANILVDQGQFADALRLLKEVERLARDCGNLTGIAVALNSQARTLKLAGDREGALALRRRQADFAVEMGDRSGLATAIGAQAAAMYSAGEVDTAQSLFEEQERVLRTSDASVGLGGSVGAQAALLEECGDLDGALRLRREQESVYREILERENHSVAHSGGMDDWRHLAACLHSQGRILSNQDDAGGALKVLENEATICRSVYEATRRASRFGFDEERKRNPQDGRELVRCLGLQASILHELEDFDGALDLLHEGESICRKIDDNFELADILHFRGVSFRVAGRPGEALDCWREETAILRKLGEDTGLANSLLEQALVLRTAADYAAADLAFLEAEACYRRVGAEEDIARTLYWHAMSLRDAGRPDEANQCWRTSAELRAHAGQQAAQFGCLQQVAETLRREGRLDAAISELDAIDAATLVLDDLDRRQQSIGLRAMVLADAGRSDEASAALDEKERICSEIGSQEGVAWTHANRAYVAARAGASAGVVVACLARAYEVANAVDDVEVARSMVDETIEDVKRAGLDEYLKPLRVLHDELAGEDSPDT